MGKEKSGFVCPSCGAALEVNVAFKPAPAKTPKRLNMEDVKALFPGDLEAMLSFETTNNYIIVKPRNYLGSENFAKIASIVRDASGEYISAGKESHFRI